MAAEVVRAYKTDSPEETQAIAEALAREAVAGDIFALNGDLGVGKTVFAKGFARGLGIEEPITSPTFTILQEYDTGRLPLYHFDIYRIEDSGEMEETGLSEYLDGAGVCLIEWAERIADILPEGINYITIEKDASASPDRRIINVEKVTEAKQA